MIVSPNHTALLQSPFTQDIYILLVGMQTNVTVMKNIMEALKRFLKTTSVPSRNGTVGNVSQELELDGQRHVPLCSHPSHIRAENWA